MPNVENQSILRRIEDVVNRRDQFDGAKAGREMTTGLRNPCENLIANLACNLLDLIPRQLTKIRRSINAVEQLLVFAFFRSVRTDRVGGSSLLILTHFFLRTA